MKVLILIFLIVLAVPVYAGIIELTPDSVVCHGTLSQCPAVKEHTWFGNVSDNYAKTTEGVFRINFFDNLSGKYFIVGYAVKNGIYASYVSPLSENIRIYNKNNKTCPAVCVCNKTITCPLGSLDSFAYKFNSGFSIKNLKIEKYNKFIKISDVDRSFVTKEKIILDNGNWFINRTKMNVMPDDIKTSGNIELIGRNYVVTFVNHKRLLFLFPVVFKRTVYIDISSGHINVKEPWWSFLAW